MEGLNSTTRGKERTLKPGRRREDNIEINGQEVGWGKGGGGMDCVISLRIATIGGLCEP